MQSLLLEKIQDGSCQCSNDIEESVRLTVRGGVNGGLNVSNVLLFFILGQSTTVKPTNTLHIPLRTTMTKRSTNSPFNKLAIHQRQQTESRLSRRMPQGCQKQTQQRHLKRKLPLPTAHNHLIVQ